MNATGVADDPRTISYKWALAVLENQFGEARSLVAQAKAKGVEGPGLDNMERTTSEGARNYWTRLGLWFACFALLLGATGLAGRALASRRRAPPAARKRSVRAGSGSRRGVVEVRPRATAAAWAPSTSALVADV